MTDDQQENISEQNNTDETINDSQTQSSSGLAIAGMVLGIVGIVTSIIPIINNISFIIGFIGLILAIVGMVSVSKGKRKGKGFAIVGLVLNILTIVAVLGSQALYSAAIDSAVDSMKAQTDSSSQQADSKESDANSSASAYEVTIDGARIDADYAGNRAIVVTYTFTNNSDKDAQFATAISDKAYQNGVELEMAINTAWNSGTDQMKTIKTGSTITVNQGFKLVDSSPVTVEVKEMFDYQNTIIAEATFDVE